MEQYFQEAGCAGLPAKGHIYYNSYDISKGKKQLSQVMRDYVQAHKCKREIILGSKKCLQEMMLSPIAVITINTFAVVKIA